LPDRILWHPTVSYLSSITDTLAKLKVPEKLFTAGHGSAPRSPTQTSSSLVFLGVLGGRLP
jgi:hypothetical protein